MPPDLSFHRLLDQLRQRDDHAAQLVYDRFAQRLIALARAQMAQRLAQKIDPEDVIQSAFHSVFRGLHEGRFTLGDWNSLWALLTAVSINKCRKWVDYYTAQARDLAREVGPAGGDGSDASWHVLDREPAPSEALALAETLEQVLEGLEPREREMVTLSLQGESVSDVSKRLDCTESKVYRVLRLVRQRLERLREEQE